MKKTMILIPILTGAVCMILTALRIIAPLTRIPEFDVNMILAIVLICFIVKNSFTEKNTERFFSAIIAALSFGVLPLCAGFEIDALKSGFIGGILYSIAEVFFAGIHRRTEGSAVAAVINAFLLFLAFQPFQGMALLTA